MSFPSRPSPAVRRLAGERPGDKPPAATAHAHQRRLLGAAGGLPARDHHAQGTPAQVRLTKLWNETRSDICFCYAWKERRRALALLREEICCMQTVHF